MDDAGASGTSFGRLTVWTPSRVVAVFRIYETRNGVLRLARGEVTDALVREGVVQPQQDASRACIAQFTLAQVPNSNYSEFFLDENWRQIGHLGQGARRFDDFAAVFRQPATRRAPQNNAARINNFSFTADSAAQNLRMEYAHPEIKTGAAAWRALSGFHMAGKTKIYYQKSEAEYSGDNWTIYAESVSGRFNSENGNAPLHGFSAGARTQKLLRRDDFYHIRLHTPFSETENRRWELSAVAGAGPARNHLRFGVSRRITGGETRAQLFYFLEF